MNSKSNSIFSLRFAALLAVALAPALRASPYVVRKAHVFIQTGASGAVEDSHASYVFQAQANSSVTLHLPGGNTQALPFDAGNNSYGIPIFYADKASLDAAYPNGTYTMTGTGVPTLTFNLTTDLYPTATPQVTNGTWNGGVLTIDPTQNNPVNLSTFSTYATGGVAGHEIFQLDKDNGSFTQEIATQAVLGLTASSTPFTSVAIPANTLTAGNVYRLRVSFDTIPTLDTSSVPGNGVIAIFTNTVEVWVAAIGSGTATLPAPTIVSQPSSQTAPLGGTATFVAKIDNHGSGQGVKFRPFWCFNGGELSIAPNDPKYRVDMNNGLVSLAISNVTANDVGSYYLKYVDIGGLVTTNTVTLAIGPAGAAPDTPSSLGAFASGATEATVTWLAAPGGSAVNGYKLERAADAGFTTGTIQINLATTSTSYVDPTLAAGTTYFYRVSAVNASGSSAPTAAVQVQSPATNGSGTASFANIATRAYCSTGNNVTIGGFVVSGAAPKRVLIRAVGPSLTAQGLNASEVLLDPMIEVHDAIHGNVVVATNDNVADNANAAEIATVGGRIGANALLNTDTTSSALLLPLAPGVYSFVVKGKGNASGVVLLEIYDADAAPTGSRFANIASRAYCTTNNGVTIGGFVIAGTARKQVLVRAVGPTLTTQGIGQTEVLPDPVIELHDAIHGNVLIATNDNAGDNANADAIRTTGARIGATPLSATDTTSSALLLTLQPGVYSFIAHGKTAAPSGIVLVEVYDAD